MVAVVVAQAGHALAESDVVAALKSEIAGFKVPKNLLRERYGTPQL